MITFKPKYYSTINNMVQKITAQLDRDRIEEYDTSDTISKTDISIGTDLHDVKIYIPEELDYIQYQLDKWIRKNLIGCQTDIDFDRNMYIVTLKKDLTLPNYIKLVKFIIEQEGFVIIYNNL